MTPKQKRIDLLTAMIARAQRDNDDLAARYGTGVRPGWISCDEGMNLRQIEVCEAEIARLNDLPDETARVTSVSATSLGVLKVMIQEHVSDCEKQGLQFARVTATHIAGNHRAEVQFVEVR